MKTILSCAAFLCGFALISIVVVSCAPTAAPAQKFAGATPLESSVRLADSEMARRGDSLVWKPGGKAKWDYSAGLFTLALLKLNEKIPTPRYVEFTEQAIGSFVASNRMKSYSSENFQIQ